MDAEERALFAEAVEAAAARAAGGSLDGALVELGWTDALAEDEGAAVAVLFEAQGRTASRSGALGAVLARALGVAPGPGAVVLPRPPSSAPPGRGAGDSLELDGVALAGAEAGPLVVVAATPDGPTWTTVEEGPGRRTVAGFDPDLGLVEVRGRCRVARAEPLAADAWDAAVAAGRRALGHELVGVAATMLALARAHALDRIQFGVPIASFQAVRHKLAEVHVAVEAARAALAAAEESGAVLDAAAAKAVAGRTARVASTHCQQVLAGIGFTLEHPFHHGLRRARVLDGLLGDARTLSRELGERLLADRTVPPMLPLTEGPRAGQVL